MLLPDHVVHLDEAPRRVRPRVAERDERAAPSERLPAVYMPNATCTGRHVPVVVLEPGPA